MRTGHFRFSVGALDCIALSDGALVCGPPDDPPRGRGAVRERSPGRSRRRRREGRGDSALDAVERRVHLPPGRARARSGSWSTPAPATSTRAPGDWSRTSPAPASLPSDIDAVILSHGHRTTSAVCIDRDGSPVFPAARVLLSRGEWEFWMEGEAERALARRERRSLIDFARQTLPDLQECLELIDEEGRAGQRGALPAGARSHARPPRGGAVVALPAAPRHRRPRPSPAARGTPRVALRGRRRPRPRRADAAGALRDGRRRGLPRPRVPLPLPRPRPVEHPRLRLELDEHLLRSTGPAQGPKTRRVGTRRVPPVCPIVIAWVA